MSNYIDKTASLTSAQRQVIINHGTEAPYTGKYNEAIRNGTYLCKRCGLALFRANSQFHSGCGWPSFDVQIPNTVNELPDPDSSRIEIRCRRCDAHLGHVFDGELFTKNNRRFCVNSASLDFVENDSCMDTEEAIVAGGCFWGVEHYLKKIPGVLLVESGYTGGYTLSPNYEQICNSDTGHYEAVRIIYDPNITNYEEIIRNFFEIHDPTQVMGQGPDLGFQYQSAIFYYNEDQLQQSKLLIQELNRNNFNIVTKLLPVQTFWRAEDYHQSYYERTGKEPYCHRRIKRF